MQLKDKIAIVTGGTGGIGSATVRRFAQEGAKVVITDLDSPLGTALVDEITGAGGQAIFIPADLRDKDQLAHIFETTIEQFGGVDIIVNNAGIEGPFGPLHDTTNEAWDDLISINQTGLFLCMRIGIQHFLGAQKPGIIVNVASVAGIGQAAGMAAYGATKHAVVGLTRAAAVEYGKLGIRINAVCPGIIKTPMTERGINGMDDVFQRIQKSLALRRFGEAHEIASAICFLASNESSYMTGQTLVVDGGMRA
ncbi:MAG: SDR family oxidoreductase [Bacteroidota bacterium]